MKFLMLFLLFSSIGATFAQTTLSSPNKTLSNSNVDFLLGTWIADAAKYGITFNLFLNALTLTQEGSYTYNFLKTDSLPLTGVSMTWPPHKCTVVKLKENHIEVAYKLFGDTIPFLIQYTKKDSL
ncbi:hypothetical protein BH11BAC2_BH11BAC2_15650 [soil metagenome]